MLNLPITWPKNPQVFAFECHCSFNLEWTKTPWRFAEIWHWITRGCSHQLGDLKTVWSVKIQENSMNSIHPSIRLQILTYLSKKQSLSTDSRERVLCESVGIAPHLFSTYPYGRSKVSSMKWDESLHRRASTNSRQTESQIADPSHHWILDFNLLVV